MPTVHIPSDLRDLTGGARSVSVDGRTVREVIDELEERHPGVRARLVVGDRLRPGLIVVLDGAQARRGLQSPIDGAAEIFFVPAIAGGGIEVRHEDA